MDSIAPTRSPLRCPQPYPQVTHILWSAWNGTPTYWGFAAPSVKRCAGSAFRRREADPPPDSEEPCSCPQDLRQRVPRCGNWPMANALAPIAPRLGAAPTTTNNRWVGAPTLAGGSRDPVAGCGSQPGARWCLAVRLTPAVSSRSMLRTPGRWRCRRAGGCPDPWRVCRAGTPRLACTDP